MDANTTQFDAVASYRRRALELEELRHVAFALGSVLLGLRASYARDSLEFAALSEATDMDPPVRPYGHCGACKSAGSH